MMRNPLSDSLSLNTNQTEHDYSLALLAEYRRQKKIMVLFSCAKPVTSPQ